MMLSHCSNIGFVEKAKAVANNTFGVDVFVGSVSGFPNAIFTNGSTTLSSECTSLTGVEKANCACSVYARDRGKSGTYRAWISTGSPGNIDAICNIQGQLTSGCAVSESIGPFTARVGSETITLAESYAELSVSGTRGALDSTPGVLITGSTIAGRSTGIDCTGYTAGGSFTGGDKSASGAAFTAQTTFDCASTSGTILCMRRPK